MTDPRPTEPVAPAPTLVVRSAEPDEENEEWWMLARHIPLWFWLALVSPLIVGIYMAITG